MKRLFLLLGLLFAGAAPAEGIDVNLSAQALRGLYAGSLTDLFPRVSGVYEFGGIIGEEDERDFVQAHAGLLVTGDAGAAHANVIAGLGGRVAVLDNDGVTGGALALGGMFEGRLPAFNRIGFIAYAYGAPKASAFSDLEGYLEYAFGIDYQVLRTASVYAGYRQLKVDAKDIGDITVDNGWHLGLRLNFCGAMAGHSKWANIQYRKGAQDKKRGKRFTKLIREITVAARAGGDPAGNPRLRIAVDKALSANMAKDTIERAIARGTGELGGANLEEVRYEGYGPGGVAILVECMTDNRTRTVGEVRHAFARHGGHLGADGSVAYLFQRLGVIGFETGADPARAERILEVALEASADDVVTEDGWTEVITRPEAFEPVKQALVAAGLAPAQADVTWRPQTTVAVEGEQAETVLKLLEKLDELDDVQNVHTNADLPEHVLAAA